MLTGNSRKNATFAINHDAFRRLRNGKGHLHQQTIRQLPGFYFQYPIVTLAESPGAGANITNEIFQAADIPFQGLLHQLANNFTIQRQIVMKTLRLATEKMVNKRQPLILSAFGDGQNFDNDRYPANKCRQKVLFQIFGRGEYQAYGGAAFIAAFA